MINVTVINLKDLIKYLLVFVVCISVILGVAKFTFDKKNNIKQIAEGEINKVTSYAFTECLDITIPAMKQLSGTIAQIAQDENERLDTSVEQTYLEKMLTIELGMINSVTNEDLSNLNLDIEGLSLDDLDEIIKTDLETQVIGDKNLNEKYTNDFNSVRIKNESDYELTEEIYDMESSIVNKKDIVIFHTHTCESYTPTDNFWYEMTGSYRTTDLNYSVARVGTELEKYLKGYGFNVKHDTTYHDYPAYSGSYGRSLETVDNILKDYSAEIVFDIHRDAVGNGSEYGPTVKIGDEVAAQLMFVIGTSGGGLEHPNWKENLKFAMMVQQKADEIYPGLFRPIMVRNTRYNQHLTKGASIIEVGATGNTMEESLVSIKYLSKILNEVLK